MKLSLEKYKFLTLIIFRQAHYYKLFFIKKKCHMDQNRQNSSFFKINLYALVV